MSASSRRPTCGSRKRSPPADLYYRLNVLTIQLPPLREREGDVEVLATYFLREIARELQREMQGFTPAAMAALLSYPWPGNVRELIATMRRAVLLADGSLINVADLRLEPVQITLTRPVKPAARLRRQEGVTWPERGSDAERAEILQALQENRFNMTRAASALGVSRATLYRKLQRNRIRLAQQFLVRGWASWVRPTIEFFWSAIALAALA
jgi:DNA-binding NtrC family response regulator